MATHAEEVRERARDFPFLWIYLLALLAVVALVLWPLGELRLAASFAKGIGLLYLTTYVVFLAVLLVQRALRVSLESRADAFLLSNLAVASVLVTGWSAFAALRVHAAAAGDPLWRAGVLWLAGLLTVHGAYSLVGTWYFGQFYRYKILPLAAAAFALFAVWPAAARFLYGWYFRVW